MKKLLRLAKCPICGGFSSGMHPNNVCDDCYKKGL